MDDGSLPYLMSHSKQIQCSQMINNHYDGISDICIDNTDKTLIAASSFDYTISIYDTISFKEQSQLTGHQKGVWTCNYHPQEKKLLSGGSDNLVKLWDTKTSKTISTLKHHNNFIYDVQFSSNGKYFGSCSKDTICVWDTANLSEPIDVIESSKGFNGFIYCMNFIHNDTKIITGFIDGTIVIHSIGDFNKENDITTIIPSKYANPEKELSIYSKSVYSLNKLHNKEDTVILAHSDGSVRLYHVPKENPKLKLIDAFYYFTEPATCANASLDDKRLIACGKDRTAEIWKVDTHKKIDYTLIGHKNIISSAVFLTENTVVTGAYDNSVRFWKIERD